MLKAYPVAGKKKSAEICEAFVAGAPADAVGSVFYGVDASNDEAWRDAKHNGPWWYIDNAYFDSTRQMYFRVTKSRLQHGGKGKSDGTRFAALGIELQPWRDGEHIVVCPQSDHFMRDIVRYHGNWLADALYDLHALTKRPIRIRPWSADKAKLGATLRAELEQAYALVTWTSAAAITAAVNGVRTVSMGHSAAGPMSGKIFDIENLPTPERENWCGVLADNQFTLAEMSGGEAWRMLNPD